MELNYAFSKKNATRRTSSIFPPGIVVWFQDNGWMDSDLMIKYIDYFNDIRSKNGTRRNPEMLVYDSFKAT